MCSQANASMFLNVLKLINSYFVQKNRVIVIDMKVYLQKYDAAFVGRFRKHVRNYDIAQEGRKFIQWLKKRPYIMWHDQLLIILVEVFLKKN